MVTYRYWYWRGFVGEQVRRYLDCGLFENGFARIRCPDCTEEFLLAFSCKTRELCPSCAAKRSATTAACTVTGLDAWPKVGDRLEIDGELWRVVEVSDRWVLEREPN